MSYLPLTCMLRDATTNQPLKSTAGGRSPGFLTLLILALAVTGGNQTGLAQDLSSSSTNTNSTQQTTNRTDPGTDPGPDYFNNELGRQEILRARERTRYFQVFSDTQYLYDSNILLADGEFIEVGHDSVFIENAGVSFSPRIVEPVSSTIYYQHNLIRYDEFSKFDYDGDIAGLQLSSPLKHGLTLYGGFSASRYYFREGGHEFYKVLDTQLGIGREQQLGSRASLVYGYQLDWRPTDPTILTRVDNALYAGINVGLTRRLSAGALYRIRARAYYRDDRTDLDHLVNLTLLFACTDNLSVRFAVTYGANNSTIDARDYQVFNVGGGLNLTLKF